MTRLEATRVVLHAECEIKMKNNEKGLYPMSFACHLYTPYGHNCFHLDNPYISTHVLDLKFSDYEKNDKIQLNDKLIVIERRFSDRTNSTQHFHI